ncbi:site-specific integrase [Frigoriglobus tundricola]|uniref:site-specific integrase n=1 Tax=Frigoriglobus tundricola TaxID=2774151 RepID=UPI00148EBB14|nr:site-specific integrase [Frigoriglobus tundricola]
MIEAEKKLSVKQYLDDWLAAKRTGGYKPASLIAWGQTVKELTALFGTKALTALTHADGEAYRAAMQGRKLRLTTVNKRLIHARQMLEDAVRFGHISATPWKHVRQRQGDPSERRAYVSVADTNRVIEHCPNVWWKLLVALARFGGLRTPSESFSLTWGDVDWERGRLSVPSPKTEGAGKPHRVIPLFTLLRPYVEAAFEHAEEGSTFVFPLEYRKRAHGPAGWVNANLRTTFEKVIRRAGVDPWPRLWHSLRASCESDLAQSFPLATVTKWLGNTPSVALRHYVDPTEGAFDRAASWVPESGAKSGAQEAQNAAQQVPAASRREPQEGGANNDGVAGYATPCDSLRDTANLSSGGAGHGIVAIRGIRKFNQNNNLRRWKFQARQLPGPFSEQNQNTSGCTKRWCRAAVSCSSNEQETPSFVYSAMHRFNRCNILARSL